MTINTLLNHLLKYAEKNQILQPDDRDYAINQLLYLFSLQSFIPENIHEDLDFFQLLEALIDYAMKNKLISDDSESTCDNFEAKMMDSFLPRPSEMNRLFYQHYKDGPKVATDYFYHISQATNYIKTNRIKKNISYKYQGKYGSLDITINLSKPEKDPKTIALVNNNKTDNYPACALCMENVGFYGTSEKAARSNHRVISMTLNHEKNEWGFQYSPYSYYNEHCIILKKNHEPMRVDHNTFKELIDFINKFPHYLIGSNAGLPIVGGSILSHYHFQGGRFDFPIEKAKVLQHFKKRHVEVEILDWPLSVIRLTGNNEFNLLDMVIAIFESWKQYSNASLGIHSETTEKHNTITPIVKLKDGKYQFYIVLRNNLTTSERPYGLFHPRDEYFHIKKENIGLIEVMGLAVLPGRLKSELDLIKKCMIENLDFAQFPDLEKHLIWINEIKDKAMNEIDIDSFLKQEVGKVFELVLEDCGVFKAKDYKSFEHFVLKAIE
jgi:UDPglucose--hexose-1-phosphate uridylyltransferase